MASAALDLGYCCMGIHLPGTGYDIAMGNNRSDNEFWIIAYDV